MQSLCLKQIPNFPTVYVRKLDLLAFARLHLHVIICYLFVLNILITININVILLINLLRELSLIYNTVFPLIEDKTPSNTRRL